jgi:hypothetical protein
VFLTALPVDVVAPHRRSRGAEVVTLLYDDPGFDAVDDSPLSESWSGHVIAMSARRGNTGPLGGVHQACWTQKEAHT